MLDKKSFLYFSNIKRPLTSNSYWKVDEKDIYYFFFIFMKNIEIWKLRREEEKWRNKEILN